MKNDAGALDGVRGLRETEERADRARVSEGVVRVTAPLARALETEADVDPRPSHTCSPVGNR